MKFRLVLGSALAALATIGCAATPKTHVQSTVPSPHGNAEAARATTPGFLYIYKQCKGPYTDIGPAVEEMWAYALTKGVPNPIVHVVYYDDPATVDPRVARCDVGFECPEAAESDFSDSPYARRDVPSLEVVSLVVKGPPTTTWECYATLSRWAGEQGFPLDAGAPVYEKYLGGPGTPDAEFPVEIRMPLAGSRQEP